MTLNVYQILQDPNWVSTDVLKDSMFASSLKIQKVPNAAWWCRHAREPGHSSMRATRFLTQNLLSTSALSPRHISQQSVRSCHNHHDTQHGTSDQLTHTDKLGKASMVNVGDKASSRRTATASARVLLSPKAFHLVRANQLAKGDALSVAQLAGIMGAKQTFNLIPLCHPVSLDHASVTVELQEEEHVAVVSAMCQATGRTGVEMEALTAATVAALVLYDMCKAVSRDIVITDIKLLSKTGGRRGDFHRNQLNS